MTQRDDLNGTIVEFFCQTVGANDEGLCSARRQQPHVWFKFAVNSDGPSYDIAVGVNGGLGGGDDSLINELLYGGVVDAHLFELRAVPAVDP